MHPAYSLSFAPARNRMGWLATLMLLAGLLFPGLAAAANSPYCPTLAATVAAGGSVTIDVSNCDGDGNFGIGWDGNQPTHGTIMISAQSGSGTQTVTYTHDGGSATSDSFPLEDEDGGIINVNITITQTSTTPSASISVTPSSLNEDSGSAFTYTVTLSASRTSATTVSLTASGTATAGTDYSGAVSSVVVAANATTATFAITPVADTTVEPDETVVYTLASGTGYTIGSPTSATATIVNDDALAMVPTSLPAGTAETTYTQTFSTTQGTEPYTYSLTSGTLPGGLSLSSGGVLSGTPTAAGNYTFTVTVTDGNAFQTSRGYALTIVAPTIVVSPTSLTPATQNSAYSQTISASGGAEPYTYAITAGALPTGLTLSTGGVLSGTPTVSGSYNVTVTATDAGGFIGARAYTLTVAAPTLQLPATTLAAGTAGTAYSAAINAATGGTTPYTYALSAGALPAGISVNSGTGALSGTPMTAGTFSFTLTVTDNANAQASRAYSLSISAPSIGLTPTSLPAATRDTSYSQVVSASGGAEPYTYAITSGTLPTGLAFSTSGAFSGTPSVQGTYTLTLTATDSNGFTGSRAYTLTVASPALALPATTLAAGTAGQAYTAAINPATGGTAPYTYALSAGALPAGVSFNSGTGAFSGTPTAAGSFSFSVTVTDSAAVQASRAYSLTIAAPTLALSPSSLPAGQAGTAYAQTISASGGIAPYTYALASGALPSGMALTSTGALSGTPTAAGTFNLRITATDSTAGAAGTVSADYSLVVAAPTIAMTPATLPAAVRGTAYQQALTASGGTGPYQFAVVSGALPAGVTLSTSGALSGTPTVDGTFNLRVQATDALNFTGTIDYAWSVAQNVPVAVDDAATVLSGSAAVVAVSANDQGAITAIKLSTQPAHGAATVEGLKVRYASTAGYSGSDSFTYAAIGPGGTSAPATVRVTVNPVPVAVDRTASATSGIATAVELTEGASGGPFTGATLVELSPANAGSAVIRQSGSGAAARYTLTYTPAVAFSGVAAARYTLTNQYATSAVSTITFQVSARPDPSKDPEVTGLIEAQAASARRFGETQINNFRQRMESLHGGREERAGFHNGITFSARRQCEDSSVRLPGQACGRDAHRDVAMREDLSAAPASDSTQQGPLIGLWSAGAIRSGSERGNSQRDSVDFQTDGVSVGADYRVNPRFAWGGGLGWARDDSDVGHNGSYSDGTAQTIGLYASYHPGQRFFVDGLIGYQNLTYDLARHVTVNGGRVDADRDGRQWLASLSVGADLAFWESLQLTPYGRLDVVRGTLDGYEERGDQLYALRYGAMDVATTTGNAGLKLAFRHKTPWGWIAPQLRAEYQRDFQGRSTARFGYADVLDGLAYGSTVQNQDRSRFSISAGGQLQTESGLNTRLEVQSVLGNSGDSDHGIMLNIEKTY